MLIDVNSVFVLRFSFCLNSFFLAYFCSWVDLLVEIKRKIDSWSRLKVTNVDNIT